MAEFWDLFNFLWYSVYSFLNTSIVTIGSVNISLWEFALGFTILGMILCFLARLFSRD